MYKYACRDLGVDCDYVTEAQSVKEVKKAVFAHADVVHVELLQSMNQEELADLQKAVDGAIKPA